MREINWHQVKERRDKLERSLRRAVDLVNHEPNTKVSASSRELAIKKLQAALAYFRLHPLVDDAEVVSFFDRNAYPDEQYVEIMNTLARRDAFKMRRFLSIPREQMEKEFSKDGRVEYPPALRALYRAYTAE